MTTAPLHVRRGLTAAALVVVLVAVVVAVLVYRSSRGGAAANDCGPLPAEPGNTVNGVTAALSSVPATFTGTHVVNATMLLSADPAPSSVESTDSAHLLLVDDREKVVGSGNFAFNAVAPTVRIVDADGLVMQAAGFAYRCADLDDPSANTRDPLAAGDYRVAGVLYTEAGYLVTPLRPISVSAER